MTVPYAQRFFEDYPVGEVVEIGEHLVTEDEIVEFATKYDPQPFHVDAQAAKASSFGGLIASGWMTASIVMRLLVDRYISKVASMGSPGIDELRWTQPVRPGDRIRVRITTVDARRSKSKPDRGILQFRQEALNQRDEVVMTLSGMGMYRCRSVE